MRVRRLTPERVDSPEADPGLLKASLAQVSQVNRWLGGDRGVRWALGPLVQAGGRMGLLDLGAGDGTTLARMDRWAGRRGCRIRGTALDAHPEACTFAAENLDAASNLAVVRGDALRLPFATDGFDAVLASLTLHHFDEDRCLSALREMARVARRYVVVSDLKRCWPAYLGARLLALTVWRGNPYTRHDGPVSVRRGFLEGELAGMARRAGLVNVEVKTHVPFRITLRGDVPRAKRRRPDADRGRT